MIQVISSTNRPGSRSLKLANHVAGLITQANGTCEVLDLKSIDFSPVDGSQYFAPEKPKSIADAVAKVNAADGLLFVVPEYNGSFPGVLKYFIDHWSYPLSFEKRPIAFIGLGGMFGGLRPVEHLMQVMSYRNAFLFPERVFIRNANKDLEDLSKLDPTTAHLLDSQAKNFVRFIKALKAEKLHTLP